MKFLPFAFKRFLIKLRDLSMPQNLFGRLNSHSFNADISRYATARRWRHIKIGCQSIVEKGVHFHTNDEGEGHRILIEEACYVGQNCFFSAGELIQLKSHCLIGASCNFLAAGHVYQNPLVSYANAPVISYGSMYLGVNTWVGAGSTLVGDVKVGFGSIIGAGSVLRKSIPPLCLVAGNPAHIVKVFDWVDKSWIVVSNEAVLLESQMNHHLASLPSEDNYLEFLLTKN